MYVQVHIVLRACTFFCMGLDALLWPAACGLRAAGSGLNNPPPDHDTLLPPSHKPSN